MTVFGVLLGASGLLGGLASATTYYVSSSSGNDANSGTSTANAWRTVAKVNGQTFGAGDSILFKRGDVWNESLVPPSSGVSGNPITFDAYGVGAAPNLTGYYSVPGSAWIHVIGNAWKAPLPSGYSTINFCLFGSIWGQKVSASTSNLTAAWDFYLANGYVYVYSVGSPATYYNATIAPMALSNVPVINVNGKSWLVMQHFLVNWFDQYGVYVQGASDHLVFANMEADSMIPQGTQPLGFYVNEAAPGPGDIKIYNAEAHMNYDGFRFDGAATAVTMVNDKAYANRDSALVDNTEAVTYSYCHFYASSLAVAGSTDVTWTIGTGPTAGAGNVAVDTPANVQVWQRYPANVTLTVDDAGMTSGTDTYYSSTVLPIADAAGVPVGAAITVGYPLAQTLVSEFQGWINAGRDVTSHSWSHTYYTNTDALDIQYSGTNATAKLSISHSSSTCSSLGVAAPTCLVISAGADSVAYNVAQGQTQGTILGLQQALTATGKFTATENPTCQGPYGTGCSAYTKGALLAQDLADISLVDVKTAVYAIQLDVTRLTTDEITLSRQWMTTNLTGLPATPVYVYPGGYETTTMQGITAGVPYGGARGALKEDLGVKDTYASGFDIQNVTSFGVNPSWMGLTPQALQQKVQALVWKEQVWGVPWGIFWHWNSSTGTGELSSTEITNLIADLKASGAAIVSNTALVNLLAQGTLESGTDGNFYYKSPATSTTLDFRPTANSPVVDAGQNLGSAYAIDINGVNQNSYGTGWEIGAHAYLPESTYGENNPPVGTYFAIGSAGPLQGSAQLPLNWVNPNEITPPGGTYDVTRTATTFAQLQQAICDWAAAPDQWWLVQVTHGTVIDTTSTGYTCTQTGSSKVSALTLMAKVVSSGAPTKFIVFDSDTPLNSGQTVCSHGITDAAATRQPPSGDISTWWASGNNGCANDIGSMWTLEGNWSPGNFGMLIQSGAWDSATNVGPSHYAFKDVELRPIASSTNAGFMVNSDVGIAAGSAPTIGSQEASHIHFVNLYGHGDATDWCATATGSGACATSANAGGPRNNKISAFMHLKLCSWCSVTYSYFDYVTSTGADNHVIGVDETPGPLLVGHNWLSGGSEAFFTGGVTATDPLYTVSDVFIWQNRLTNPASWVGSGYGGSSLVIKNRSETKACVRCLFDGNIAEYVDTSGGQQGQCYYSEPRACSAGPCDNYQVSVQDVTYTNNICRHAETGFLMIGRSGYPASGGGAAGAERRVNVSNNLMYDLGDGPLYDPGNVVPFAYGLRADSGGQVYVCGGNNVSGIIALNCTQGPSGLLQTQINPGDPIVVTDCSDSTWNVPGGSFTTQKGATALVGTNPTGMTVVYSNPAAVSSTATGCLVQNFEGFPANLNFAHNTLVMQTTAGSRNNGRMYDGSAGTVFTDAGCTGAGATNSTTITSLSRAGGIVTAAVASTAGWSTGISQTIVEVLGSGDFTGTFYYLGQSGGNLQWMQAGANETGTTLGTVQQAGTCPANHFMQNATWKNNLLAFDIGTAASCPGSGSSGWTGWVTQGDGDQEGCASGASSSGCSENAVDVTNSVATHTDFPGRCGAKYMEVGGANAGAIPPVTLTFPASTVCSGGTADSTCVGMQGMMSGAAFDENDADYHNYALVATSQYKAGAANDADDGADLGADIGAIDNAETRLAYTCGTFCGTGSKALPPKIEILAPGAGASTTAVNTYLKPSPYINGIVYPLWWSCSDQDGTSAHYTWTNFDNQIASDGWAAAGKKIFVVLGGVTYGGSDSVCYGGGGYGTSGVGNYGTPTYVWTALGSSNYATCTTSSGTQQIPNYLNSAYLTNYQNWVAATLAHLASASYAKSIGYVRIAWGKGGETTPIANWDAAGTCLDGGGNNTLTTDWGYTISGWNAFLKSGMQFEAGLESHLQLMISITPMGPSGGSQGAVPNATAPVAASLHIGFGTQGLMASDVNNVPGCGGNWCNLFATYAGKVPLETQTFFQSCASTNESGTCPGMAVTTGTLDPLLMWAARNHATSFEMYYEDACAMLCPGFNISGYAAYSQAGYMTALRNVVGGNY
ncbi:MAG TPA: hypothetical protein VMH04_19220 [Candidatus Solibacter sp.]|nr:hypothetical protein [Candidatus Solibacter sp.]